MGKKIKHVFNTLTEDDKKYIVKLYNSNLSHKEKTDTIYKKYGIQERQCRAWFQKLGLSKKTSEHNNEQLIKASERLIAENTEILLITSAQNNTKVNDFFLDNLVAYKNYIEQTLNKKCQIIITASRYRNPTSLKEDEKSNAENNWDSKVEPYLFYRDILFNDVRIAGNIFISPTAKNPMSGFDLLASNHHLILSHSKIHLKTIPRYRGDKLRIMSTTGYITVSNYSKSKSGAVGEANHSYGFIVVEKKNEEECYNPRNVKVNSDGSFTDICYEIHNGVVERVTSCQAVILGDIHTRVLNKDFYNYTKLILNEIVPDKIVLHDVFDGSTINHHEEKDMYIKRKKIRDGKYLLEEEIDEALDFISDVSKITKTYVVESNHHVFLDTHINSMNWKNDLHNSPTYLKLAYIQQTQDLDVNLFGHLVREKFNKKDVEYIRYGDRMFVSSYNLGAHGEHGSNGSRGSAKGFANLNQKMIHGHVHSPSIVDGVTSVGVTSQLNQYYNRRGLSSWAYAHAFIHNTGKPQLIIFDDEDYGFTSLF
jgi:hypothetical protein